jgi:hypothetical protein
MLSPLFLNDTLQNILVRLSMDDFNNAKLVCRDWNNLASGLESKRGLLTDFRINESVVDSLQCRHSHDRVYRRLVKIVNRGQNFLKEYKLYRLYCVGGTINEDFLHLLDNNIPWFKHFFAGRDAFFLAEHLQYACIIGNITLVIYLIEQKDCKPDSTHVNLAATSGRLTLVKYLLKNQQCKAIRSGIEDIFFSALSSGRVKLVQYLIKKYHWEPSEEEFCISVSSGSYDLVKYLHETHGLQGERVTLFHIKCSKNLAIIKYMAEDLEWHPSDMHVDSFLKTGADRFVDTAYEMGMLDVIDYVESRFPLQFLKDSICFTNAMRSGSVAALKYLLKQYNAVPSTLKERADDQYMLAKGILSGNLDMVLYLVNECGIKPTRGDLLQCAIESGNVSVVLYLIRTHGYEITPELCQSAFNNGNLELVTLLLSKCNQPDKFHFINSLCKNEQYLMMIYHLLDTGIIIADESMLESVFSAYIEDEDKEQLHSFYTYLIQTHHLVPTEEMVNWMAAKEQEETQENTPRYG